MSGRRNGPSARRRGPQSQAPSQGRPGAAAPAAAPAAAVAPVAAVPAPRTVEEPAPAVAVPAPAVAVPVEAPRHRVLEIEGELTVHTAADRRAVLVTLLDAGGDLDLDLSGVTELDTAGLQLLLLARREAQRNGARLVLTATSRVVDDVLAIAHLDRTLSGVDNALEVAR